MPTDMALPAITLEELEDRSPYAEDGFLRLRRRVMRARYPDGSVSRPFIYDSVLRRALDAVIIVAYHVRRDGEVRVYLRSAVRPPLLEREKMPVESAGLWEVPAGLVEPGEESPEGVRAAARRELLEELGFDVPLAAVKDLGLDMFPAPAIIGERHFFCVVEVDPSSAQAPTLDGSALEVGARIVDVPLVEALRLCRVGTVRDEKTELALRRLQEHLHQSTIAGVSTRGHL